MRLHVLSDIHLEHAEFSLPSTDADVVVLAGDIAPGTAGLRWAQDALGQRPVLYVAGNHEFYGHALPGLTAELRAAAEGSAVRVLERDELEIDGVRFLGCTLWSDFQYAGEQLTERSMAIAERVVNDYKQISSSDTGQPLRPAQTRALHLSSRAWLRERLAVAHDGPTVVITHHAPLVRARPQNPTLAAIAGAFATDLSELMGGERVDLWIFGHVHRTVDTEVRGTRVISNQRGYPHEPVAGFDPGLVVSV